MSHEKYFSNFFNVNCISNTKTTRTVKSMAKSAYTKRISKKIFFAFFTILIGISILLIQPYKIVHRIKLTLTEGGELFGLWLHGNIDPLLKVYIFNITNKDDFLQGKEKLRLQEVGPYIYRDIRQHQNPKFNHMDGTVTTTTKISYEWIPELNTRKEDDIFVLPNIAMLLFAQNFAGKINLVNIAVNFFIKTTESYPIVKQSVKDLLLGAENPFTTLGYYYARHWIMFKNLGLLEQIRGFTVETLTTYTGEKDYDLAGRTAKYNNLTYLPHWKAPCNRIVGSTDGKKFGNNIPPNEILYIFQRSFCRSIPFIRAGPMTVSDQWLPTVPYKFKEDAFDNGKINSENKCFCREGHECLPSGLIDVTPCYYGFSTSLSQPHFYNAHPSLLQQVDGLQPNESLHETIWYMNPEAGILTNFSLKLQFNLVLGDISDIAHCEKFSNLILPVIWVEVTFSRLNSITALRLYFALQILPIMEKIIAFTSLLTGIFCIAQEIRSMRTTQSTCITKTIKIDHITNLKSNCLKHKKVALRNDAAEIYLKTLLLPQESSKRLADGSRLL